MHFSVINKKRTHRQLVLRDEKPGDALGGGEEAEVVQVVALEVEVSEAGEQAGLCRPQQRRAAQVVPVQDKASQRGVAQVWGRGGGQLVLRRCRNDILSC